MIRTFSEGVSCGEKDSFAGRVIVSLEKGATLTPTEAVDILREVTKQDPNYIVGKDVFRKAQASVTKSLTGKVGISDPLRRIPKPELRKLLAQRYPEEIYSGITTKAATQAFEKAGIKATAKMIGKLTLKLTKLAAGAAAVVGLVKLIEWGMEEIRPDKTPAEMPETKSEFSENPAIPRGSYFHPERGWYD